MKVDQSDKLILSLADSPELEEYFAQKEPGETCSFQVQATMDEINNKLVTLSVTDVDVQAYKSKKKEKAEVKGDPETEEPALKWAGKTGGYNSGE